MTMYKRFSVIIFLVLFLSLFISTTMKFHFVVGILWILCTCTLFCMFRFVSNKKCQPFKNTWHGLKVEEDGGKIYQRLLEYIDLPTKLTTITEEGVPTYWHTLFFIMINEYHVS